MKVVQVTQDPLYDIRDPNGISGEPLIIGGVIVGSIIAIGSGIILCCAPGGASIGIPLLILGISPYAGFGTYKGITKLKKLYQNRRKLQNSIARKGLCFKCGLMINKEEIILKSKKRKLPYHKRCPGKLTLKDKFNNFIILPKYQLKK